MITLDKNSDITQIASLNQSVCYTKEINFSFSTYIFMAITLLRIRFKDFQGLSWIALTIFEGKCENVGNAECKEWIG